MGGGGGGATAPSIIFERLELSQQIIYRRKGNLPESPNQSKYRENILISQFYEQFSRKSRNLGHFGSSKNFKLTKHKHIIYHFERVIWRFQIYNLFREDKSNNEFREILKCFRETAKFDFFAKQILYLESPYHALQNDI